MKNKLFLISFFFLLCFPLTSQNIKLVFRYDDFSLKNDSLNEGVIAIFQKHQIPLVLGVIPFDSNEKLILEKDYPFLSVLNKGVHNQSIEIALHGLNHQKLIDGEFGRVNKDEQYRRIYKGKAFLDSIFQIKIVTFIPPWNAYDENTLDALENNGIKGISSALCVGQPFSNSKISYFPETIEDFGTLISVLENNENRDGVVVVMFHHYTFKNGYTLVDLDSLLSSINGMTQVKCVTFQQLYNAGEKSDEKRMLANIESNLLYKYLHLKGIIQTSIHAYIIRVLNVLLYIAWCLIIYLLSFRLLNRKDIIKNKNYFLLGSVLIISIGFFVWFHLLTPLKLLLAFTVISILLPLLLKIKKKSISNSI